MEIVRTTLFASAVRKLGASVAELDALERQLASNPDAGDIIPGLRGVRKVRFAMKGKGKRGGGRCIFLAMMLDGIVYLLTAYDKSAQTDLSTHQRKAILALLEELK